MTHVRVSTGVIRLTAPPETHWFADPSYRGRLLRHWGHGRLDYFPNYNFTTGQAEAVPYDAPVELVTTSMAEPYADPSDAYPPSAGWP